MNIFLVINALHTISLHGSRPIVSLFADSQDVSTVVIGILVSLYAFLPALIALQIGKWLDFHGPAKMTFIGGGGMLIAFLVPVLLPNLFALAFSQVLIGASNIFIVVALQKKIGNLPGNRDKLIAGFSLSTSIGGLLGPLVSTLTYDHFGFQVSFAVCSMFTCLALLLGMLLKTDKWQLGMTTFSMRSEQQSSSSPWKLLKKKDLRHAVIISGMVLSSKDLFVVYFPLYGNEKGLSPTMIGVILAIMSAMAMVVRIIQPQLVERFTREHVLLLALICSGLSYALLPFSTAPILLAILAGIIGLGLGLGQPLSLVSTLNASPLDQQGAVLGMRLTFNRGSQFLVPIIFGGIGGLAGLTPIFWVNGAMLTMGAYFTRKRVGGSQDYTSQGINK